MARSKVVALLVAALLTGPFAIAADMNDGLIAWYPFDEGVVDKTGNIEPLEGESILPILKGKFGGAVKLDGDTFIAIPIDLGPDLNPSITISLWVKTDPRPTDAELEKRLPNQAYVVSESIAIGNLKNDSTYFYGEALNRAIVGPKHNTRRGQWQHVALVRTIEDRPNAKGEIEPHVVSQFYSGGRMSELVQPFRGQGMATDLYVGTNSPRYNHKFRGAVDELRIYDRALSQDEIGLLAKASSSRAANNASESDSTGSPDNAGTTDTSALDNVNFGGLSAGDMAVDNPADDNRNAATPVTTLPAAGGSPSVMPPNENLDDFQDRMDDPEFQDSLKAVDWNVKGMIPLTQEEKASIFPGSTITVKIRVDKDDPANKIPAVKLALKGAQSRAEAVPLRVMTSEQVPTARRDIPMTITIPSDFVFEHDGQIGTYYADTWLLTANGMPLQDTVTDNNSRRLSIQVQRPPEVEECGDTVANDDGTRTVGGCLSSDSDTDLSRVYVDNTVLFPTDLSIGGGGHFGDTVETLIVDNEGWVRGFSLLEIGDNPCEITVYSSNNPIKSNHCGERGALETNNDRDSVTVANNAAVTGIRVCRNAGNDKVKGIAVEYRTVSPDGKLSPTKLTDFYEKTNCKLLGGWTEFESCGPGSVAAGVELLWSNKTAKSGRMYIHSIDLLCGQLKVREDA